MHTRTEPLTSHQKTLLVAVVTDGLAFGLAAYYALSDPHFFGYCTYFITRVLLIAGIGLTITMIAAPRTFFRDHNLLLILAALVSAAIISWLIADWKIFSQFTGAVCATIYTLAGIVILIMISEIYWKFFSGILWLDRWRDLERYMEKSVE